MPAEKKIRVLLMGPSPPPYGGVSVHLERFLRSSRRDTAFHVDFADVRKLKMFEPESKTIKYCDRIKKVSSGWGGEDTGFSADAYVIDGLERSGSGIGFLPSGSSYSYDYGKMRNLMREIAEKHGWTLKITWFLPK